jgi:hypothetical protein
MTTSESFQALRRTNPRTKAGFATSVAAVDALREEIVASEVFADSGAESRTRLARVSAAGVLLVAAAAVVASLTLGSRGGGTGVEGAVAAVKEAATVTAASAERSGSATVRISHNGELWAGSTIRWNNEDLVVSSQVPQRSGRPRTELRLVDGTMYGIDPDRGGWVVLGSPRSIDPRSGTTPAEYLAAVREDVGGVTLHRITDAMAGLKTRTLDDGSNVYSGTVAAGLIARGSGFKEGRAIRVLPFGYVAHDEAANPGAPLKVAVTVGADGIVREIAVTWGTGASAWQYTVTYRGLGATSAPVAPANARPLRDRSPGDD